MAQTIFGALDACPTLLYDSLATVPLIPGDEDDDEGENVAAVEVVEVEEEQGHPHEGGHVALQPLYRS
jgi:hypothetical protein